MSIINSYVCHATPPSAYSANGDRQKFLDAAVVTRSSSKFTAGKLVGFGLLREEKNLKKIFHHTHDR